MRYSIQPRDRIFVKSYGFLSFAKNMGKILVNAAKNLLIMLKSLQKMHVKLLQKESFKKQEM